MGVIVKGILPHIYHVKIIEAQQSALKPYDQSLSTTVPNNDTMAPCVPESRLADQRPLVPDLDLLDPLHVVQLPQEEPHVARRQSQSHVGGAGHLQDDGHAEVLVHARRLVPHDGVHLEHLKTSSCHKYRVSHLLVDWVGLT